MVIDHQEYKYLNIHSSLQSLQQQPVGRQPMPQPMMPQPMMPQQPMYQNAGQTPIYQPGYQPPQQNPGYPQETRGMGRPTAGHMDRMGNSQAPQRARKKRVSTVAYNEPPVYNHNMVNDVAPEAPSVDIVLLDNSNKEYKKGIDMNETNKEVLSRMTPVPTTGVLGDEIYASMVSAIDSGEDVSNSCACISAEYHFPPALEGRYSDLGSDNINDVIATLSNNISNGDRLSTWFDTLLTKYFNILFSEFVEKGTTVDSFVFDYNDITDYSSSLHTEEAKDSFNKVVTKILELLAGATITNNNDSPTRTVAVAESYLVLDAEEFPDIDQYMNASTTDNVVISAGSGGNTYLALSDLLAAAQEGTMCYLLTDTHKYLISGIRGADHIILSA